ncbi:RNA polymerase factor sigma-54 [Aliihoeflea sp. PC F10.4]
MGLGARLQLRQSQSLVMTPQLLQSIRLLQFTQLELDAFIDAEIERNPLLERAEAEEPVNDEPSGSEPSSEDGVDQWFDASDQSSSQRMSDQLDTSLENVFPDEPGIGALPSSSRVSTGQVDNDFDFLELTAARPDLRQHVREQIALTIRDPKDRLIAGELADALDDDGYMRADIGEIADRLGAAQGDVKHVLASCQTFDPAGLFARDLSECLSLQLRARDRLDPAMAAMIGNLELVARRDFAGLKRLCGVDEADLLDMLAELRGLDPRPGHAFTVETAEIIKPDVVVRAAPDGSWAIDLNADALPRVLVNQTYAATVSRGSRDSRDREFVSECLQSANWLARSLDQRAKTILKVAAEIVRQQDAFLAHGVRHLRPLNLKQVAEAIGMHESTVSRVTANKFMMTPRGVFEFRYFFTVAIAAAGGGDAHSSEAVRDRIRAMIDAEHPGNVLSDDAIVAVLVKEGIEIARRTVAKYREGMNIASSVQRRREKRARAALTA